MPDVETSYSEELGRLMDRLQQLLEARVVAMIIMTPTGDIRLEVAHTARDVIGNILRTGDWQGMADQFDA